MAAQNNHPLNQHLLAGVSMLVVNDLDRSVAFYRDKLGIEVLEQIEHIASLSNGVMNLFLFIESPPTPDKPSFTLEDRNAPGRTSVIIDLLVDDCRAAYAALQSILNPTTRTALGGSRCFAQDPDGYLIEIEESADSPVI